MASNRGRGRARGRMYGIEIHDQQPSTSRDAERERYTETRATGNDNRITVEKLAKSLAELTELVKGMQQERVKHGPENSGARDLDENQINNIILEVSRNITRPENNETNETDPPGKK